MSKLMIILFCGLCSVAVGGCANGGTAMGNGNAGGGNVSIGPMNADVTPCVNMPGASSGNCKTEATKQ